MRILGIIIFVTIVALACTGHLVNIPSVLIVIGGTIAMLLAAFGSGVWSAFKAVFSGSPDRDSIETGIAVWERGKSFAIASGMLGTLIGFVLMLQSMDDPASIGPAMGVALLTMLYSLLLAYGLFVPLVNSLQQKLEEAGD